MKQSYLIIIVLLLISKFCFGQNLDIIEAEQTKSELHLSNIGKIFFTEKRISYETLTKEDFLRTYKLTNKSNLFFVAYFNNTLPKFSADSLFKLGNYQFTLYIDRKLIYQSNLLPGAPPAKNQNTDTYLDRPFVDNINGQGTWSESFWNRFMQNGGNKVLTDGSHLLKMEIRPYIKMDTIKTGEIIASGELLLEVDRLPKIDIKKIQLNKPLPYNGMAVSSESFDTNRIKQLKGAIEEGVFKKINSIIVLKEGKIQIEEYFNGENRNSLHDPRSVGKSFSSTLTGIAITDGLIKSETQTISDFYKLNEF